ncbi:MerR family transcriptional regulator [Bacillus sp. AGMB 02131]|uniref:MerR family transcriptional regulator n=1 Tax=Peribacillus faecalis TaxID=2772559 RepID=A0A927HD72_9BACI|nr:MerR family transcriptional regulator [Peribacillus faecalis]MBD3109148.1 MerR family transcriptional regulator [Peribacillus faecalis]
MKETLYTIGEVSKLSNVSIKALRYYDKIGLFKPVHVDPETNYRYYKDSQLYHLDLIKSLKYIGTPLEEMKKAQALKLNDKLSFMTEQERIIEEQLQDLLKVQQTIQSVKKRIQRQIETPALGIAFQWQEEETRIIQAKVADLNPENILNASYSKLKHIVESTDGFLPMGYGTSFTYQYYSEIDDITYNHLFTPVLTDNTVSPLPPGMEITSIPAGTYACITYIYSHEQYLSQIQKLVNYVEQQQLTVISDIYETFIPLRYSPDQHEEYMIELKVQVQ